MICIKYDRLYLLDMSAIFNCNYNFYLKNDVSANGNFEMEEIMDNIRMFIEIHTFLKLMKNIH